jgi:hypothetical protein
MYGRDHRDADDEAIDALGTESVEGSLTVVDLLTELVTTDEFLHIRVVQEGA